MMQEQVSLNECQLRYLLSAEAARESSQRMLQYCLNDNTHFSIEWNKLDALADFVIDITKKQYPNQQIPLHSRWRHFYLNNKDRAAFLQQPENFVNVSEQVKSQIDLVIVSVLLDAGAGSDWRYFDYQSQNYFSRSEGLALATLQMFVSGLFSNVPNEPWRVDAEKLIKLNPEMLMQAMQVNERNPLPGLTERTKLLNDLGEILLHTFKNNESHRPSELLNYLRDHCNHVIPADELLQVILKLFNELWPKRLVATVGESSINLGDVGYYSSWNHQQCFSALVPFHKLSTWLTLSLIEPLALAGIEVNRLDLLPGLAEYRNGGLFIDSGVLQIKDAHYLQQSYSPQDAIIIEWRALTIALLDALAVTIRHKLGRTIEQLPLPNILQGGTWLAGRQLAFERRPEGSPPIKIKSDGTVF